MKNQLWAMIIVISSLLGFFVGWTTSSGTGVEPGYFEAPEAGGYGAGTDSSTPEGVSEELQEYYKDLTE